jgi:REP element-mobilizing transposase RayT
MGRPLRIEYPGALYHITSRGNERRKIFLDAYDRGKFLDILRDYHDRFGILLHSYVLMDNHYHLIIETPSGNLLKVMHGINSGYTGYFNRRYKRSGHLFQGRYKAILVDKDIYLVELSRYIHLNPVKAGMVEKPAHYRWSSYRGYIGMRKNEEWVEYAWVLGQFGESGKSSRQKYREYTEKEIEQKGKNPFDNLWGQVVLGGKEFREHVKEMIQGQPISGEIVERKRLEERSSPEGIIRAVASEFGAEEEEIIKKGKRQNIARSVAMHIVQKHSGLTNEAVGNIFGGIHYSAVTKSSMRLQEIVKRDKNLEKRVQKVISYVKT